MADLLLSEEALALKRQIEDAQAEARSNVEDSYGQAKRRKIEQGEFLHSDVNTGERTEVLERVTDREDTLTIPPAFVTFRTMEQAQEIVQRAHAAKTSTTSVGYHRVSA